MSTSSCHSESQLSDEEKQQMRDIREDILREIYREAIVKDLLTIYTSSFINHRENPVAELLAGLDIAIGVDKRRIFLEVLKESIAILEVSCNEESGSDSV